MTHVQPTHAGTNAFLPAAFAALVMAAALALAIVANGIPSTLSIGSGADNAAPAVDRAAVDAGRAWQLQREQQAGIGVISDAVRRSAADWEQQREAQSGQGYQSPDEKVMAPGL